MTPEEALQRCNETRSSYSATRRLKDSFWTLQMAYNEGQQWGFITENSGNSTVQMMKGLFDLNSARRVRITINEIQAKTAKAASMTSPQQIRATVKGPCGAMDTYTRAADKVLEALLSRIGAKKHLRSVNKDHGIIGSSGIRQVLRRVGSQKIGVRAQGRREDAMLSQYEIDWAPVQPWEVIRSPGARSIEFERDEDAIGHEKPRTLQWMMETYGWAPETDTQYGQVAHFLDEIHRLENGPGSPPLMSEAREKAVIPCEYWLTDAAETARIYDKTGIRVRWPWWFVGFIDPSKGNGQIQPIPKIGEAGLVRNPFCGPALKFLHYHVATEAMWGTGLPWLLMQWQDFSNIGYTWLAEVLQQCAPKWLYEAGTLERGMEKKILNNDPRQPIPWKRATPNSAPPSREQGAQIPQMASEIVNMAPEGMNRQASIAGVQMGQGYKRDGSGEAYQTLISEAESVPEDRVTGYEITIGELLKDTLIDTIRHLTLDQLDRLTGGRVGETALKMLKRDDPRLRIEACVLHPTTMRPKTRQQTEERYSSIIQHQILPQDIGVREAIRAGVTGWDTDRERAYQLQEAEIELMREGRPAEVLVGDEHAWHLEIIRSELNSPNRLDFSPDYLMMLQQHELAHQIAIDETTGMAMGQPELPPEQPARGSAPAAGQATTGPAGPQLRIA